MARTVKLRSQAEAHKAWVLERNPERYWDNILRLWDPAKHPKLEADALKPLYDGRFRINASDNRFKTANLEVIAARNPTMTPEGHEFFYSLYSGLLNSGNRSGGERSLFSFLLLNEFMGQTAHERYGDFLEAEWDRVHEDMLQLRFSVNAQTQSLRPLFYRGNSLFEMRVRNPKDAVEAVENLTVEIITSLLNRHTSENFICPANAIVGRLESLKRLPRESPTTLAVKDEFTMAFTESLTHHGSPSPHGMATLFFNTLLTTEKFMDATGGGRGYARTDAISTDSLLVFATVMRKNSSEVTPNFVRRFLNLVEAPTYFAGGNSGKEASRRFLSKVAEQPEDVIFAIMKTMDYVSRVCKGAPHLKLWEEALKDGLFASPVSPDITLALMGHEV